MKAVEEIINVNDLRLILNRLVDSGEIRNIMDEIIVQSRAEFS